MRAVCRVADHDWACVDPFNRSIILVGSNPGRLSHITIFTPLNLQSTVDALNNRGASSVRFVPAAVLFDTDSGLCKSFTSYKYP